MNDNVQELSLLDILRIAWQRRKTVMFFMILFAVCALTYALFTPKIYRAECRILPPSQGGNRMNGLLAQVGGLADLVGFPGTATSGQLMIDILHGDTVVDAIINQFSLMTIYEKETRLKMRETVIKDILDVTENPKSGVVEVAVLDEDPERAAEMANAFVEELKKRLQGLALTEAAQRRLFFEGQLKQAQQTMGEAEDTMLRYQQSSGVVVLEPQMEALLTSITTLRSQIAEKNIEISALRTYAKRDNPNLKVAESQLAAMIQEVRRLEEEQKKTDTSRTAPPDAFSSISQAPELGMEYLRHKRDLQFATAMYEMMLKQFEAAKLDEARDFSPLQIIDPAIPPDYKFKPKRAQITIIGLMLGLCTGIFWVFCADYFNAMKRNGQ